MNNIESMVTELVASGVRPEVAARIVAAAFVAGCQSSGSDNSTRHRVDETAERRRAWDREYRRKKREFPPDIHPNPPEVGKVALSSFSLTDSKSLSEEVRKKENKRRGLKLPPDWQPKEKHYEEGAKHGMSRGEVDDRAGMMRDWSDANANRSVTTKADWDATFMGTWIKGRRNDGIRTRSNRVSGETNSSAIIAGVAAAAQRRAEERCTARREGPLAGNVSATEEPNPELFEAAGN